MKRISIALVLSMFVLSSCGGKVVCDSYRKADFTKHNTHKVKVKN